MRHLFVIALLCSLLSISVGELQLLDTNQTFYAPQIVPRGIGWPKFPPVTGYIQLFDETNPDCQAIEGLIAFFIIHADWDNTLNRLVDCGAAGSIVFGTEYIFAGSSFHRMANVKLFGNDTYLFPVVELGVQNGSIVLEMAMNASAEVPPRRLYATINAVESNIWREYVYGSWLLIPIVTGSVSVTVVILASINLSRHRLLRLEQRTVPDYINSLILVGNVITIMGVIDFNGFWQVFPTRLAEWFSNGGIGFIMGACWFRAVLMMNIIRKTTEPNLIIISRDARIYFTIFAFLTAMDWSFSLSISSNMTSPTIGLGLGITWSVTTAVFAWTLCIIYSVAFARFFVAYRRNLEYRRNDKRNQTKRLKISVITNVLTAVGIFVYGLVSVIAFAGFVGYPDRALTFYFVQPLILRLVSLNVAIASHFDTSAHLETNDGSTATGSNTKTPSSGAELSTHNPLSGAPPDVSGRSKQSPESHASAEP